MSYVVSALLGALTWSLAEYLIHRFDGHGMKGKTRFSKEHLAHHANADYFAAWWKKAAAAVPAVSLAGLASVWLAGWSLGLTYTAFFALTYLGYEVVHRRIHTHAPRNAYARWARRHHLYHHFKSPKMNHGVTSPIWDIVFGTHVPVEGALRVPPKQVMRWLCDDSGAVRPELTADYELVRRRARA